jgi:7,8-dihydroneopterin aldolase/epimerase/oxygenase
MGKILIEDIEIYAYHGHMPEENKIGNRFIINLELDTTFEAACESDKLDDTFDYEIAYSIVREEMQKTSVLLEHIAGRILKRLFEASSLIWAAKVNISKMSPPFRGKVKAVSVELHQEREQ